ncbi:CBS domain-containing protein [Halovenus sp. WSH3]|uniref:CBS domain-containing protein n=2 Tax=Halovenus carboxidivorans TaxID=2692199 RepID=A0A6B0T4W8_9EURY|nr:CBS domain-containing protein [Halovenus carboxidivorans]
MTESVYTVGPEATACAVAKLFARRDVGSALVVDQDSGETLGIVTESDIMRQVASGADTGAVRVETFLSRSLVSVSSSEEIHTAAALMRERSLQRLPVVDDGETVGMLTTSDLTDYLPRLRNTIRRTSQTARRR